MPVLKGYADLHCHPLAHLGFGGAGIGVGKRRLFWGTPDWEAHHPDPASQALSCCDPAHSIFNSPNLLPYIIECDHGVGAPSFADWPAHSTILHQQMFVDWIRRAFEGGLRLICALAVHNRMLADVFGYPEGHDSRDSTAYLAQIRETKRFVARHAWMQVVSSADEARDAIQHDKLAVVLGIEVDSLGDWRSEDDCANADVDLLVRQLHAEGVRTLTPVHLANNAFGGCSFSNDRYSVLNHYLGDGPRRGTHRFFEIEPVGSGPNGVQFLLDTDPGRVVPVNSYLRMIRGSRDPGVQKNYPTYRKIRNDGHRNAAGLTKRGHRLVERLMRAGMLLDVDHMSDRTRDAVLTLAENEKYPVYSSHTSFRKLGLEKQGSSMTGVANEGMLTEATLKRILGMKGIVAPITRQGPTGKHVEGLPVTPRDHPHDTALSFAHAYKYALDVMGNDRVAVGTDFNGFAEQPGPRKRGTRWTGPAAGVRYDIDKYVQFDEVLRRYSLRGRSFDYNTEGLAHYGLLPDFLRDVDNLLGASGLLDPFFHSAERFIEMWKTCETRAAALGGGP